MGLEAAVKQYSRMLYRICIVILGSEEDTQDAVQDTFCKYLERKPEFADTEHEKAWLIKVATNHCRDIQRFWFRHPRVSIEELAGTLVFQQEDREAIRELLHMPPKQRAVMVLHYIEGYQVKEIAGILKMKPGEDGGTVEQTAMEKEINLAVVLKMRELLENQGICVVLTREQDIFMKLEERVRVANGEKADLFVSIHCNYYEKDSSIYGLECYYCKGAEDGKYYAERILDTIEKSGEIVSRNAKPSGYYILKNTTVPAVLVEAGYLSNYNERNQLISGEYQGKRAQELVERIVEGLEGKAG